MGTKEAGSTGEPLYFRCMQHSKGEDINIYDLEDMVYQSKNTTQVKQYVT